MVLLRRVHDYEGRPCPFVDSLTKTTHDTWPYRERAIYADAGGVLYSEPTPEEDAPGDTGSTFLAPFCLDFFDKEGVVPGHIVDAAAPYRCGRCHTDRVQCFHAGEYETNIRCPECGTQTVVHSG